MRCLIPLFTSLTLCALASAQDPCATLTVSGDGAAGSDMTFAIATDGGAGAIALVLIGETAADPNSGTLPFALPGLDIGLEPPFLPVPLGRTDANGDISRTFTVPMGLNLPELDLLAQGMTIEFSFMLPFGGNMLGGGMMPFFSFNFCTSDLVPFQIGG